MIENRFTEEETELLRKYQQISTSALSGRLVVEIVPPIVFIGVWLFTGHALYLLALIALLVSYNFFRVLKQNKSLLKLNSISKKAIGEVPNKKAPSTDDHAA